MNPERFEQYLLRYGAAPEHWPWHRRGVLRRLLRRSPEARARLARMAALEQALGGDQQPLSAGLQRRLEAIPLQYPQLRSPGWNTANPERRLLRLGLGWALACGMAGVLIGAGGRWPAMDDDAAVALVVADLAAGSPEVWGVADLGLGP